VSIKKDLDELIAWYDANKPEAGKQIPVRCTRDTVRKFAKRTRKGGAFMYREREIIPMRKSRKELETLA
jgi:hypothetical protein